MTPVLWLVLGAVLFLAAILGLMKLWQLAKYEDAKRDENVPENDAAIRERVNTAERLGAIARQRVQEIESRESLAGKGQQNRRGR